MFHARDHRLAGSRSQCRHPFGPGRAELILMHISLIPPPEITQGHHNLLDRATMVGQRGAKIYVRGRQLHRGDGRDAAP
jgi:hypothetical protein